MDGSAREAERAGTQQISAFHIKKSGRTFCAQPILQSDVRTRAHSKAIAKQERVSLDFARSALGVRCVFASLYYAMKSRRAYFAALTIAMPHGPSPTLIRRNSLRDFTSITETSFDAPFAV
jgi:hypothetical protein